MPSRSAVLALFLAGGCVAALGQTPASIVTIAGQGCPVSFSARRDGMQVARARFDGTIPPPAAYLEVHFAPASASRILSVEGVVHGATAVPHLEGAAGQGSGTSGPHERTQPFHLAGFGNRGSSLDWQLTVAAMPLIKGVSLSEIRLADGTVWRESPVSHCHVEVGGFLPVGALLSPGAVLERESPR